MKGVLAATGLIGFALLASGCSYPTAYTVRNETDSTLTIVVTWTSCNIRPQSQDDYVHEATVGPGRAVTNHDGWAYDEKVQCFRILNQDQEVILEEWYVAAFDYGEGPEYTIDSTRSRTRKWVPIMDDFPGPSLSERILDRTLSIAQTVLIVFVIAVAAVMYLALVFSLGAGLGGFTILAIPAVIGYFAYQGVRALWKRRRDPPPLN